MSYETLIRNLYKLKEKVPHVKKIISMVMMRQNVCEMPELVELAHEVGADQVVFLNLNPNLIIGNAQDVMLNYPKTAQYYSAKAMEKGKELGVHVVAANAPDPALSFVLTISGMNSGRCRACRCGNRRRKSRKC